MNKIANRKYPAWVVEKVGKWFTGWEGFAFTEEKKQSFRKQYPYWDFEKSGEENKSVKAVDHETRTLRLQFSHMGKGRSSATAIFKDSDDFPYQISLNTLCTILQVLHQPPQTGPYYKYDVREERVMTGGGTWITGTFMQVKKGQNYFIEPVEVASFEK